MESQMPDGKLHVKSERDVKRLLQKQQRARTDAEIPEMPGAGKRLERLEKRVVELEKWKLGAEHRIQELMAWIIQEGGGK
jgi:hypothetical protein